MRAKRAVYTSLLLPVISNAIAASGQLAEDLRDLNTSFSIAYQLTHLDYVEPSNTEAFYLPDNHSYLDKESGNLMGVRLGASWMGDKDQHSIYASLLYSRVESDDISYVGHYQDGTPVSLTGQSAIGDWWLRAGRGFVTAKNVLLTAHAGLGYHYWHRGLQNQGYEYYTHKEWDIGGTLQYAPARRCALTAMLAVGRTFGVRFEYPDAGIEETDLGPSDLIKAGIEFDYEVADSWHLFLGADYYSFRYGQSEVINGVVMEPLSYTELINVALGVRISR
jgi:hypothetical protein